MAAKFEGFSTEALSFYEGLEDDNSKAYWAAHKAVYDVHVKGAMESFLSSLPADYQPFRVFRPNRDVRFAKDKSPYKTMHGATSETSQEGLRDRTGWQPSAKDSAQGLSGRSSSH